MNDTDEILKQSIVTLREEKLAWAHRKKALVLPFEGSPLGSDGYLIDVDDVLRQRILDQIDSALVYCKDALTRGAVAGAAHDH